MPKTPNTREIEKICLREFGFFIRRHRRYLMTFLGIYTYSLFSWNRMRLLRAGHCLFQHIDDVLDGDRLVDAPALTYVDDLLGQIESGQYNFATPISTLAWYVFSEADVRLRENVDIRSSLLNLIHTLRFDRERLDARATFPESVLAAHHRETFLHSVNLSLMMVDSPLRAADVPEIVDALAWVSPMRDLRDDLARGIINVPKEVIEQAQHEGATSIEYDALLATPAVRAWVRREFERGEQHLRALPARLRQCWPKRGTLEIFFFFVEIQRYATAYQHRHRELLDIKP